MSRVVLASRIFAPESAAATFRLGALTKALRGAGHRVEVLTATPPAALESALDDEAAEGIEVSRWPVLRDDAGYVRGYVPYMSFDIPLALRLLLMDHADAVVVEPPPTTGAVVRTALWLRALIKQEPQIPYIYYGADVWSDASESTGAPEWVVRVVRALEGYALRGAAETIAVSDGVADRVKELGALSVTVVPNGINTDIFDTAADGGVTGKTNPYFVYAGTASEWQGAEVFAQAMSHVLETHPGARLVFLGQGSSWPELLRLQGELPEGALELRPLVPAAEAAVWQRDAVGALVSVKPGLGYDFAYPTKVLAALACGTPVVFAGPGPAAADVAAHELGKAVEHDANAVAQAMIDVLDEHSSQGDEQALAHNQRRRQWVLDHRSLAATGRGAVEVVNRVLRRR